jgi:hypothetical protein
MQCPCGLSIKTVAGSFGRTRDDLCPLAVEGAPSPSIGIAPSTATAIGTCEADVLEPLADLCDGKGSCDIKADASLAPGDACPDAARKYLSAQYTCSPYTATACEGTSLSFQCPSTWQQIKIKSAVYGRTKPGLEVCPIDRSSLQAINTLQCGVSVDSIVKSSCEDKNECTIDASNEALVSGNDPCPGTFKYLEVAYACEGEETLPLPLISGVWLDSDGDLVRLIVDDSSLEGRLEGYWMATGRGTGRGEFQGICTWVIYCKNILCYYCKKYWVMYCIVQCNFVYVYMLYVIAVSPSLVSP